MSTTSARGVATTYAYWPNRALHPTDAPADGGARAVTETFYDGAGRVARTLDPVATADGERPETTLSYSPGRSCDGGTCGGPDNSAEVDEVSCVAGKKPNGRPVGASPEGSVRVSATQSTYLRPLSA